MLCPLFSRESERTLRASSNIMMTSEKYIRIHHFLPECIAFNQSTECTAQLLARMHCATNNSNKKTRKFVGESVHRSLLRLKSFLCGRFSSARLEVISNLRHAGVFQMSTTSWLTCGLDFKSL